MRGSLRIHSPINVVLLIGWSLLAQARERVPWTRTTPKATPLGPVRPNPTIDPKLWN